MWNWVGRTDNYLLITGSWAGGLSDGDKKEEIVFGVPRREQRQRLEREGREAEQSFAKEDSGSGADGGWFGLHYPTTGRD